MSCNFNIPIPVSITPVLSGYTRITEFTIFPSLTGTDSIANKFYTDISQTSLYVDFGDGTHTTATSSLSVNHIYNQPGQYTISMYVYDNNGRAYLNTLTKTISVYNFVPTGVYSDQSSIIIEAGNLDPLKNTITFSVSATWQDYVSSQPLTLYCTSSGGDSKEYHENIKYSHLVPFHAFYQNQNNDYVLVKKIDIELTPAWFTLSSNNVPVLTSSSVSTAKLLGARGTAEVMFFDDLPGISNAIIALDTKDHVGILPIRNTSNFSYMESPTYTTQITCISAVPTQIIFSSTGLKNMPVASNKRQYSKFQVFAYVANVSGYPLKFYNPILSGQPTTIGEGKLYLDCNNTSYNSFISSLSTSYLPYNTSTNQSEVSGALFAVVCPQTIGTHTLSAAYRIPFRSEYLNLTGSHVFNVYSVTGDNILFKLNEDIDATQQYKNYRFQDFLLDYEIFFNDFIGAIVGSLSSLPTTIGKTVYERIANFTINTADPDTANMDKIYSFYQFLNQPITKHNYTFPPNLKRIFDIFSVKIRKLVGGVEYFGESFNPQYSDNTAYGKNVDLTSKLNLTTYVLTADTPIVCRQKFNNVYFKITPQKVIGRDVYGNTSSVSADTLSTYPISAWNQVSNWGWSLDTSLTGTDLNISYEFYPYTNYYNNAVKDSLIDFNNTYTTVLSTTTALSAWVDTGEIMYESYDYYLRTGLGI